MPKQAKPAKGGRFVVGVDFGTTFTSVAFAHSISPEEVKLVQSWPNGSSSGESAEQVPTELSYVSSCTEPRKYRWGNDVPPTGKNDLNTLRWFKILLQDNPADRPLPLPSNEMRAVKRMKGPSGAAIAIPTHTTPAYEASVQIRELGLHPRTVVEDFLSGVRKVAFQNMENTYDCQFVRASKTEYVITIPAIWSDCAKDSMVHACEAAGYGKHRDDFHLVTEPEAAAAYTLKVIQPHGLKKGDTFIICDAGGGTVDLISYRIQSMEPSLVLDEVVSGSGDLCGSVYLDDGFKQYIYRKLGSRVLDKMSNKAREKMEKSWREEVKFKYSSALTDSLYEVAVPGVADDEDLGVEEGYMTIDSDEVKEIFDPVVGRIIKLVDQQVRAVESREHDVAAILLVGGFGSSKYLFERLEAVTYGATQKRIQVVQPINAKTAIARGALLRGLDGTCVKDRRSRLFYGVSASDTLTDYPKAAKMAFWDACYGTMMVPDVMSWYVNKDDVFSEQKSHKLPFYRDVPVAKPNFNFETKIWASGKDIAAKFKWEPGADIFPIGTLRSNLTNIPRKFKPVFLGKDGNRYFRVDYTIKMTMVGEVLKFEVICGGQSYGEASLEFAERS